MGGFNTGYDILLGDEEELDESGLDDLADDDDFDPEEDGADLGDTYDDIDPL